MPLAKLEDSCYRSSIANHFAGSNADREAGSVNGKSLAGVSTLLSESRCGSVLQTLNASLVERLVIVVACAATVMATVVF